MLCSQTNFFMFHVWLLGRDPSTEFIKFVQKNSLSFVIIQSFANFVTFSSLILTHCVVTSKSTILRTRTWLSWTHLMVTLRRLVSNKTGLLTKSSPSIKHHGLTSSTEVHSWCLYMWLENHRHLHSQFGTLHQFFRLYSLEAYQEEKVVVGLQ